MVHNVLKLLCVQLSGIIHSTQSCIFDVKAWMIDNKMRLNFDKTEMILIAPYRFLSSYSVPQSVNLDGCDIKLSNTVRKFDVCLDPRLSFQQQISCVCHTYATWSFSASVQYATISLNMLPKNCCVRSFFQD